MSVEFLSGITTTNTDGIETMSRSARNLAQEMGHAVIVALPNAHPPFAVLISANPFDGRKPYVESYPEGSGTARLVIGTEFGAEGLFRRAAARAARTRHPSGRGSEQ